MALPSSQSPDLHLSQPTPEECTQIWSTTAASWKDSLTTSLYVIEADYLTKVPLAEKGGMSTWVLVDKNLPPNKRQILCSCESFRKRSLMSDSSGKIEEGIVHGVASVFCPEEFRGRGYGTRHMQELAKMLNGWQIDYGKSIGSTLYSDIGKKYYAKVGWTPNPTNGHYELPAVDRERPAEVHPVPESELAALCLRDERMIYKAMETPSTVGKRVVVVPNLEHMLWHIRKEEFAAKHIFGETPEVKGALAGNPGKQVWAIWTRRYYSHPIRSTERHGYHELLDENVEDSDNPLYILRLVVEGDETANKPHEGQMAPNTDSYAEQRAALKAVLQAAQVEAAEWRLKFVSLWEPSPLVHSLIGQSDLEAIWVERQEAAIASTLWFDERNTVDDSPVLINNEHYAWC